VRPAGLDDYIFVHLIACRNHDAWVLAGGMPKSRIIIHRPELEKIAREKDDLREFYPLVPARCQAAVHKQDTVLPNKTPVRQLGQAGQIFALARAMTRQTPIGLFATALEQNLTPSLANHLQSARLGTATVAQPSRLRV
jgi:hypothetical protein